MRRVACALSGGVDSAVTALLLKRRGYEVVGVHMVNWDSQDEFEDQFSCPRTRDLADAKKLSELLDIELHVVNFVKEYWSIIFEKLLKNYRNGRIVVPDIDCNKFIKFDLLWKFVTEKLGIDVIATGHFARTSQGEFLQNSANQKVKLLRAKDPLKDQTYFLSSLNHRQIHNVMFPVGSFYKNEVRKIANGAGLIRFTEKQESMGICFIGKKANFSEFLSRYIDPVEGSFVDIDTGKSIPNVKHNGVHNFALGKRIHFHGDRGGQHSLQCTSKEALYVADVDASSQIVYVCQGYSHPKLYAKCIRILRPNWIGNDLDYIRKIIENDNGRYSNNSLRMSIQRIHSPILCKLHLSSAKALDAEYLEIEPTIPLRATAPGQTCVFYSGDECLGCAEIDAVLQTL